MNWKSSFMSCLSEGSRVQQQEEEIKMLITFHHPRKVETELNSTTFILRNLPNISETLRKLFGKNFIQLFHLSLDCCMFSSLHWKKLMKSSENSISLPRNAHHSSCRGCLQNFFTDSKLNSTAIRHETGSTDEMKCWNLKLHLLLACRRCQSAAQCRHVRVKLKSAQWKSENERFFPSYFPAAVLELNSMTAAMGIISLYSPSPQKRERDENLQNEIVQESKSSAQESVHTLFPLCSAALSCTLELFLIKRKI